MEEEGKDLMEFKSPQCPYTVTVRRNPPRRAKKTPATNAPYVTPSSTTQFDRKDVPRFPIEEILQCEMPPSKTSTTEVSENIRVFLRIRPLEIKQNSKRNGDGANVVKSRLKGGISPKQDVKKKTKKKETCLVVNDTQSVTLCPPQIMQDTRRFKSEVYDGFSHVFDSDSLQKEVYDRVMDPLVSDFMAGKSGMLAAMGPTGSGKTHTVFGCPREPGMVTLALRKIFNCPGNTFISDPSRSFYISMFEICSERGKGERILDLSSNGVDLSLQQSTIKGLQEVLVSSTVEAEALIARGMLKRATAMTNSNSQSSRSQCIINIRAAHVGKVGVLPNNAVLTIVDLAGAERERKTGNQGARLLESNFINNTSMVFGLCLRSLLEHQKNPKKQFQKHFQNSLLTKYLRDYLEGKKRMTLILTVRPGEDDYLDTSGVLRQAAPYMKIKYSTVEEPTNLPQQKRHVDKVPRVEQPKRRKLQNRDVEIGEDKHANKKPPILEQEVISEQLQQLESSNISVSTPKNIKSKRLDSQHPEEACCMELAKIKRRENILQGFSKALWHVLKQYKQKVQEYEIEIQSLKANLKENVVVDSCPPDFKISETEDSDVVIDDCLSIKDLKQHSGVVIDDCLSIRDLKQQDYQVDTSQTHSMAHSSESVSEKPNDVKDSTDLKSLELDDSTPNPNIAATGLGLVVSLATSAQSKVLVGEGKYPPMERKTTLSEEKMVKFSTLSDPQVSITDEVGHADTRNVRITEQERRSPLKSSNSEKPRRRLLPASSILLKEFNGLDLETENVEPKGGRGGRKLFAEERGLSQGSVSLLRLLRTNLHL